MGVNRKFCKLHKLMLPILHSNYIDVSHYLLLLVLVICFNILFCFKSPITICRNFFINLIFFRLWFSEPFLLSFFWYCLTVALVPALISKNILKFLTTAEVWQIIKSRFIIAFSLILIWMLSEFLRLFTNALTRLSPNELFNHS